MKTRITWDEYWFEMCKLVSTRSTCLRRQVGAIAVRDNRLLCTGYNGSPTNTKHCLDIECIREKECIPSGTRHELCRAVHAEQNVITQAALHGISLKGSTLYCTHNPCNICAKLIIQAGITTIKCIDYYPDEIAIKTLEESGIEIFKKI